MVIAQAIAVFPVNLPAKLAPCDHEMLVSLAAHGPILAELTEAILGELVRAHEKIQFPVNIVPTIVHLVDQAAELVDEKWEVRPIRIGEVIAHSFVPISKGLDVAVVVKIRPLRFLPTIDLACDSGDVVEIIAKHPGHLAVVANEFGKIDVIEALSQESQPDGRKEGRHRAPDLVGYEQNDGNNIGIEEEIDF